MSIDWFKIVGYLFIAAGIWAVYWLVTNGVPWRQPAPVPVEQQSVHPKDPPKPAVPPCDCREQPIPPAIPPADVKPPKAKPENRPTPHKGEPICSSVPDIAYRYPPAQVMAYAKTKNLSAAQLNLLRYCIGG